MIIHHHQTKERDLINGCLTNDRKMQQRLYELYAPKMYGICLRYCKCANTAEDLLQDGFIKVFTNIAAYSGIGNLEGWMRRVFVHTSIEYFRKQHRLKRLLNLRAPLEFSSVTALDNLGEKDLLKFVQALPAGCRTIFNLHLVEGYSHREIAELLHIKEGTSKSQFAKARYMLQAIIKAETGTLEMA